jgi:hypothetical protein
MSERACQPRETCIRSPRRQAALGSHVIYVDNYPLVLAHARAPLASRPEGRTAYIHAGLRQPDKILSHPVTRDSLDFTQPVALMLIQAHDEPHRGRIARAVRAKQGEDAARGDALITTTHCRNISNCSVHAHTHKAWCYPTSCGTQS